MPYLNKNYGPSYLTIPFLGENCLSCNGKYYLCARVEKNLMTNNLKKIHTTQEPLKYKQNKKKFNQGSARDQVT